MKFVFHISFLFVTFVEEYNYKTRQNVILHIVVLNVLFRFGMNILLVLWYFWHPRELILEEPFGFDFMDLSGFMQTFFVVVYLSMWLLWCIQLINHKSNINTLLFALINVHPIIVLVKHLKIYVWWIIFYFSTIPFVWLMSLRN